MENRIKIGVIGGGRVGESFLRNIAREKDMVVTGMVTSTEERRHEITEKFNVPTYASLKEFLASDNKPIVMFVLNANDAHAEATIESLKGGCHVYCEKPMAPTLDECVKMVEAEKSSGKHLQIGFEYMHGTMTSRLRNLVNDGYFGDVLWASVLDSRGHWWADNPDTPIEKIWKLDRKRGGGIIFHCGIHQLDMIRCYFGQVEEISAFKPPKNPLPYYPDDIPANVTLMIRAKSGAVCNFQVFHDRAPTFYRENPPFGPDWRKVPGHEFDVSLVGSAGSCYMKIYGEELHLFKFNHALKDTEFDRTEIFGPKPADKSHHDMQGLMLRFIRSVASGKGAIDKAADALETMRMAFAAEDAISQNRTVYLKDYR